MFLCDGVNQSVSLRQKQRIKQILNPPFFFFEEKALGFNLHFVFV
jgi:hypothetical protein